MPWTQLHVAAESGDIAKAKDLLASGVNLDDRDDGDQTALHRAAGFGHASVVAFLLDSNGKVDDADESGSTPLHLASWRGQVDVVNLLVDRGAEINARGMYGDTALHLASSYGQEGACAALIQRNANINARDNGGKTPLDWALEASQSVTASLLQSKGGVESEPSKPVAEVVEEPADQEYLMKVLVVGDTGTGKTSFIKRYVHNTFSESYKATIGVDFALKSLQFNNVLVRLQLWDIAGQERFGAMTHVYYKEAVGAVIAFDSTRPATFESVLKWKTDIDDKIALPDDSPIPVLLLATKADLVQGMSEPTETQLKTFAAENNFVGHAIISSKSGVGVEDAAKLLVQSIMDATASFVIQVAENAPNLWCWGTDLVLTLQLRERRTRSERCHTGHKHGIYWLLLSRGVGNPKSSKIETQQFIRSVSRLHSWRNAIFYCLSILILHDLVP
eukprot:m.72746 g.72746  ORF g.72746 m.72746 type:complete len:447 (-) comp10152_c0_seq1:23-1363(-)